MVGGLSARTYWDWLEIDDLFVPETLRGQGLGSSLLQMAEMMAIGRGARRRNRLLSPAIPISVGIWPVHSLCIQLISARRATRRERKVYERKRV